MPLWEDLGDYVGTLLFDTNFPRVFLLITIDLLIVKIKSPTLNERNLTHLLNAPAIWAWQISSLC